MKKIAVFPGSFDPVTVGHECIIRRAALLFDELIVAVGVNADKKNYFPLEKRIEWLRTVLADLKNVRVDSYHGLTVDYCISQDAKYILRGLRTAADFEFERSVGQVNKMLNSDIENIFLLSRPEHTPVNSSIVRDIHRNGGNIQQFVPVVVAKQIMEWQ
ncbi:MAG: pantetheine-phosphate adenylyltransferase [Bacteroidetes bacterium GWF2_43_63]|nr:MAG: pantetheine-phosphate adenylyltransferase [Bacteroidetes bacterium GWE2_42_42]OFY52612.1 MAG: pantetheine-phosphate adenylyltransferase [Bacteroidetes bacterium GWF2_43_63]HBG69885.1 pantetheine-phosphate adenylyltransferase [Bacteroidales bacterium]HCB62688.1 pantetheine-phosphate adenylyltransferase [Bacteroidales bacterium]HCY23550.1 pantetheine-phosphate adenylyltransferase [Bacteroidales bacterium]